jgi:hypothetical protein
MDVAAAEIEASGFRQLTPANDESKLAHKLGSDMRNIAAKASTGAFERMLST